MGCFTGIPSTATSFLLLSDREFKAILREFKALLREYKALLREFKALLQECQNSPSTATPSPILSDRIELFWKNVRLVRENIWLFWREYMALLS